MSARVYWASNYVFGQLFLGLNSFGYYGMCWVFGVPNFTNAGFGLFFVLFILWSHAEIGMSFFLSGVLNSPGTASVSCYLIMMVMSVGGSVLTEQFDRDFPDSLLLFPPFAFVRSLRLILEGGGSTIRIDSPLFEALMYLFLMGTVLLFVGVYLHAVVPNESVGQQQSFLLCLGEVGNGKGPRVEDATRNPIGKSGVDEDVLAEEIRVYDSVIANTSDPNVAVKVINLRHTYPSRGKAQPKVAVEDLSFMLNYGECFGLLGPNGAGKTTALQVLSGALTPTGGNALIGGFDVLKDMKSIHSILGICTQFDIVWANLTVKEHLLCYAKIKGVPKADRNSEAQKIATKVKLDGDAYSFMASQLSGGMRRRLSIAIALMGNPSVIFLDEPTTGLDPGTRRDIWDIIEREKTAGRCIVITTHSMEEADALCTKIGIMTNGTLKVIGSSQHLKSRHGEGFKMVVVANEGVGVETDVMKNWVRGNVSEKAKLISNFNGNYTFMLPVDVNISGCFDVLEREKKRIGEGGSLVKEWSVSQSSLEEVFVRIAQGDVGGGIEERGGGGGGNGGGIEMVLSHE